MRQTQKRESSTNIIIHAQKERGLKLKKDDHFPNNEEQI